jgi:hypothetical protein
MPGMTSPAVAFAGKQSRQRPHTTCDGVPSGENGARHARAPPVYRLFLLSMMMARMSDVPMFSTR